MPIHPPPSPPSWQSGLLGCLLPLWKSQHPTSGTVPSRQNTFRVAYPWMDATSPTVGKKSSRHGPSETCPWKPCRCQPVHQERRASSSPSRATSPITPNSPLKAPTSLSVQGIDPLRVFPMGAKLHRPREEVGKVSITDMGLHIESISALSCLRGGLHSLPSPQPNPLPCCQTQDSRSTAVDISMGSPVSTIWLQNSVSGRYTEADLPTLNCTSRERIHLVACFFKGISHII